MKPKHTHTPEEKKAIIDGFEASGLSVPKYAEKNKISVFTFYNWRRRIDSPKKGRGKYKARGSKRFKGSTGGWAVGKIVSGDELKYDAALKQQNQILKEMLADAYQENAQLKKAA